MHSPLHSSSKSRTCFQIYRFINHNVFTREIILVVFIFYILFEKGSSTLRTGSNRTSSSSSTDSTTNPTNPLLLPNNHLRLSTVPDDHTPSFARNTQIVSSSSSSSTLSTTQPYHQRLSRPEWITNLLTIPGKTITFRKFTLNYNLNFYFPEQAVMHSAEYIVKNEVDIINYFFNTVRSIPRPHPCYIVDVGTNGGFYTLLGRTLGCYVYGIDAQPHCMDRLYSAVHVNGYSNDSSVHIKLGVISDKDGGTVEVGNSACSGLWSIKDASWINKESNGIAAVEMFQLSTLLHQWLESLSFTVTFPSITEAAALDSGGGMYSHPLKNKIQIMKMDIEGNEIIGLYSILPYIRYNIVQIFVLELLPDRIDNLNHFNHTRSVFETMYDNGYTCTTSGKMDLTIDNVLHYFNPRYKLEREQGIFPTWICSLRL